jgi:hypothetical protein
VLDRRRTLPPTGDRVGVDPGEQVLIDGGLIGVVGRSQASGREPPLHPGADAGQKLHDVVGRRWAHADEGTVAVIGPVEHECVQVHVEVQRRAEALGHQQAVVRATDLDSDDHGAPALQRSCRREPQLGPSRTDGRPSQTSVAPARSGRGGRSRWRCWRVVDLKS